MTAVKDFLAVDDAKNTIEKEVKQRPTIDELTTVESPGKPVSATTLLMKKKVRTKETKDIRILKKKEPARIDAPKKDAILIITEKPQAAKKIASALGSPITKTDLGVSYYEVQRDGNIILVASAIGHLFNLEYKEGQKGWPIFEVEWRPSYEKKNSAFSKRYYDLLKKLARRTREVVVATDYDIEGELIGWNVVRFILDRSDAKRMKFSTLTNEELLNSFANPMKEIDWNHAYAGETRHILDWLYGINLSRALMSAIKSAGAFKLLSIGRVQGPALKIIVDREKEIINFKSEPYWNVYAVINGFSYKHPKNIFDKKELENFKDIKEGKAETTNNIENVEPPHPFDLTTLQREAYRLHKISPSQTLSIAQKLYLDGLISYPRTSSQKIPFSIEPRKILKELEKNFPEAKNAKRTKPVEGAKSDPAHPSIYPTGEFSVLKEDEKKIYELIVKRFISAFSEDTVILNTKTKIIVENDPKKVFTASGLKIEERGWTAVYQPIFEESSIPQLNGEVKIDEIKTEEKETQPPRRYTTTSLITLLEKKNLGTKSTRSIIVDILFERGYLDGQSIKATPLGMNLIESLEKYSPIIIDENLTRQLEDEMEKISEMKNERSILEKKEKEIIAKAKRLIEDIAKEFKAHEAEIGKDIFKGLENLREEQRESNLLTECKKCREGNLRILFNKNSRRYFVVCSNYLKCSKTYSLPPNALIKKSDKNCAECGFPKLRSIKKAKRPWEFCFNPECPTNKKRLEEWKAKQENKEGK